MLLLLKGLLEVTDSKRVGNTCFESRSVFGKVLQEEGEGEKDENSGKELRVLENGKPVLSEGGDWRQVEPFIEFSSWDGGRDAEWR